MLIFIFVIVYYVVVEIHYFSRIHIEISYLSFILFLKKNQSRKLVGNLASTVLMNEFFFSDIEFESI